MGEPTAKLEHHHEARVPAPYLRGMDLLDAPLWNKGTAFTEEEREAFGLSGLLPPHVETLDEQVVRAYEAFRRKDDDLERYIYLRALQDSNEVLFYRLLLDHLEEMIPVVYTPVVAQGCQEFSHIYRRPRGLVIPYPLREAIPTLLAHRPHRDVDVIVVTDGERILGIGDQGVGGLGIPIGKLALYTIVGGIRPDRTLPIVLDVGTNNLDRLRDPEYLGWRHERIVGAAYDDFIAQFVRAIQLELPTTLVQWEDFGVSHARPIVERYGSELLTFNDDIQGTGAVVLGTVLAALNVTGGRLRDQRVVLFGAGSAGAGAADALRAEMVEEGLDEAGARRRFSLINRGGLLHTGRTNLTPEQQVYAASVEEISAWADPRSGPIPLSTVVRAVKPTVLIGLSTVAGAFDEPLIRDMARHTARPVILSLSNPTNRSEARPADLLAWTEGRALVATGSPFSPVEYGGREISIAQCNNAYVFPAMGLGVIASRARRVTPTMFLAAARRLAELSPASQDPDAGLLPPVRDIRSVAFELAVAIGQEAQRSGVAPRVYVETLRARTEAVRWTPSYPIYSVD
jgi:malate dehydrogenase (oxaloacetate-decarboxylating)